MAWALQCTVKVPYGQGKRVEVSLGNYPTITLAGAREAARVARETAANGVDPRGEKKVALVEAQRVKETFETVAKLTFEAKKGSLKGAGVNGRWYSPLQLHAIPTLGEMPIEEITQHTLVQCLRPIWNSKAVTATKTLNRVGIVMEHAAAMDLDVSLETVRKARILLGAQTNTPTNIEAMAWEDVPAFYASLDDKYHSHRALKFLILTGARSFPVRHAHTREMVDGVWFIPAAHMKSGVAFEIPLSTEAQRLTSLADGYLFPNTSDGVISDMAMSVLMKGRDLSARPHGMRSTLRDWLTEQTETPWDVKEKILAHSVGTQTSRAYDRSSDLKKRAVIMQAWSDYCTSGGANG